MGDTIKNDKWGGNCNYNLNEVLIGKWVDEKPLYKRTIKLKSSDFATRNKRYQVRLIPFLSNVDQIISIHGNMNVFSTDNNSTFPILVGHMLQFSNKDFYCAVTIAETDILLCNVYNTSILSKVADATITVLYTKTTD